MVRLENKFKFTTDHTKLVWIAGIDSQTFFHHTKKWKPWLAEPLTQKEDVQPIKPDHWLFTAAKWLGMSIAFLIVLAVLINIGKLYWRG